MIDLGTVKPGSTIRIPWSTFDKDDGSSITQTNYAVADILIYKDGGTTERASTAGFTATTDFDSKTGKQLTVIDLADNTTAGFYSAGSEYLVAIDAVTVDGVTTGGWIARFRIGYPGAGLDTTIASLSSQTSFTLTAGPAEDDALNGWIAVIHDVASAVQAGHAVVLDYTGSTRTVTLAAGTTFTAAATDNISFFPPVNVGYAAAVAWASGSISAAVLAADTITAAKIAADAITSAKVAAGALVYDDQITTFKSEISGLVVVLPNGHITSAKIGADAFGSDKFAAGCLVYGDQITEFDASIRSAASVAWGAAASTVRVYPADGALSAAVFAADCITSAKVAAGAFTYDDQITTFKSELSGMAISIPNGHITSAKIGADAIGSDKIAPGALVYDDQILTFKSELSGMVVSIPDGHITAAKIGADAITSAKVAAGAFTYDDQITTFKSELSGVYTRLTTQGVRDITQYTSAHVSAFPGSSPGFYDALLWNYSMHGYKRVQQPTSFVIYDAAGSTKIASATVSGTSSEVVIGTFQ